ncbi:MAG TPA: DUF3857 domain-containing protein [Polyangiaceae bacterium]|nr:DUF3857 domain-containing protein [Polyangiaceae bacterium]
MSYKPGTNVEDRRDVWVDRGRKRRTGALALAVLLTSAAFASAGPPAAGRPAAGGAVAVTPEQDLLDDQLAFERAKGLEARLWLREIWDHWEDVDPRQVEAALELARSSTRHDAPTRVYASVLAAYGRIRRGDLATARRTFREAGFVDQWLVLGPFDNEGKAGLARDEVPDREAATPIVGGRAYSGKERPVRWRTLPEVFPYGWVDLGSIFRPQTHVCGFATTFIDGGERARTITAWVGASGAYRLIFNGQTAIEETAYRGFDIDRRAVTLQLQPGQNRLTMKVCGADEAPVFAVRLADEQGRPDPKLTAQASLALSAAAEPVVKKVMESKAALPRHPASLTAPVDQVQGLLTAAQRGKPAEWEAAARYLVLTSGDDEATHQARDLAERAVEKEPTVRRLLLAASLAEDRNKARRYIEQAEEKAGAADVDVLLARAWLLRSGPNPREAFGYYDRVLELSPDHLVALQGRVELYNAAGLRRSALEALERAYERRPHSVLLASMVASQRSSLGFAEAATEAEERYAARRFDDSAWMTSRLELALNRRNPAAAGHYLSRLVAMDPQNPWGYQASARAHRALGQTDRALLDLEQARGIAPEDIGVLRSLADLKGRSGKREEQLALLQEVLRLRPQEVEVREYLDHIEPPEQPADEKYAQAPEKFLERRHAPSDGAPRRTLRDLTVSTVYPNGLSSQFRQVVFQPLTDAAAAMSRQYAFQYQADRQIVQLKGARVYRADGRIDEAIESGEGAADDPSVSMYTSARTFYVQFPRLEPGDVVEARYRIDDVTPRNEFADYFGEVVYLQNDEPVSDAEYVLVTPKSRKMYVDAAVPGLEQTVTETADQRVYRFFAPRVAAIVPEPNMPPWAELLGFVHVSTYPSWDALGAWYWGLVKEQLDVDPETRKLAREITKDKKTDVEKVQAVYNWVVKNTRYVALEFGIYGFKPHRCVQTVARGWGDCKDKATVIVTLLRELGIDANLVIVRTGMRGDFRSDLPSLAPFDHAIAYVPSLDLYLDGTAEYTGTYELPTMDRGARAILVLDGKAKQVRLPLGNPEQDIIARKVSADLQADGSAKLEVSYDTRGQAASAWRSRYEARATLRERVAQDLGREFPGLDLPEGAIKTNDLADLESPVSLSLRGKAPQFGRKEGDRLSVPVTLGVRLTPQFASLSRRTQDVVVTGFSTRREETEVELPAGYEVEASPPNVERTTRFGSFGVVYEKQGRKVTVKSHLSLTVDRVRPDDYQEFRKFCAEADQALSHRLLLAP